jgi:hypothetical protein
MCSEPWDALRSTLLHLSREGLHLRHPEARCLDEIDEFFCGVGRTTRRAVPDDYGDESSLVITTSSQRLGLLDNRSIGSRIGSVVAWDTVQFHEIVSLACLRGHSIEQASPEFRTRPVDDRGIAKLLRRERKYDAGPKAEFLRRVEPQEIRAAGRRADENSGSLSQQLRRDRITNRPDALERESWFIGWFGIDPSTSKSNDSPFNSGKGKNGSPPRCLKMDSLPQLALVFQRNVGQCSRLPR